MGNTTVTIGNELGRSNTTIGRFLNKKGLQPLNMHNGILKSDIDEIVGMYTNGMDAKEILSYFSDKIKCENTIINILRREGVNIRKRGVATSFKKDYFKTINTEAKAYYLGLLLTDGNVFKAKRNTPQYRIQISLKLSDINIIEKFKEELNAMNKISTYTTSSRSECMFSVHSNEMASDLSKYGIVERKTFNTELTTLIPDDLYRHYIRGIFDGDGTVYIRKNNQLIFGFYGTHNLVNQVKYYLIQEINISNNSTFDKETVSFVTFSKKKDVINFYNYIYKDASFFLERKKKKFEEFFVMKNIIFNANTELTSQIA